MSKGWHGDRRGHSIAARLGWARRRRMPKRADFYHRYGRIKIENRPPKEGYEEGDQAAVIRALEKIPDEDLKMLKRVNIVPPRQEDRERGWEGSVRSDKPKEIFIYHEPKDTLSFGHGTVNTLLHEMGHIVSGHLEGPSDREEILDRIEEEADEYVGFIKRNWRKDE